MAVSFRRVLGAALMGVGAIFVPKTDPREHWSSTPKVEIVAEEHDDEGSGER